MIEERRYIDSWEKWKACWPNVPWDDLLHEIELNRYDPSAYDPMIDKLQDYGVSLGTAEIFVYAMMGY